MTRPLEETWEIVTENFRTLVAVVFLVEMPYLLAYRGVVAAGWLPQEGAEGLFGLLGVLVTPVTHGAIVHIAHHWKSGIAVGLGDTLRATPRYWSRLLVTYVAISFILLGWLAVTVLPGALLMMILQIKQPLVLVPFGAAALLFALPRYAYCDALVVVEDLGAYHARHRSKDLSQGRRLKLAGYGLLVGALPLALELGTDWLAENATATLGAATVVVAAALDLLGSLLYVVPIVLFYVLYRDAVGAPAPSTGTAQPPPAGQPTLRRIK